MRKNSTPSRRGKAAYGVLAALLAATSLPAMAQDEAPTVQAGNLGGGEITVDGRLDEPAWQQAGVIQDITQQSPHPGEATPYHTKVLLLRDSHTLYIGLRCEDPEIATSAVHTMVRDGWQGNDDNVLFMLDTFGTKRFAYVFRVNSAGAMADGLQSPTPAINSNDGVDYNWDGIWQAVVTRDDHGWTAEIAIDTRSLQFTTGITRWGFNVSRDVPRVLLTLDWSGTTLDSSVYQLQREGTLAGVQDMEQGKGLDFQPYALAKYRTGKGSTSNTGFDLKYNFNPSLAGLFTYHTDFAEAEADQQQINTTRFPLFFPEKRQFFLQGSNLLSFGYNLGTTFIPFNSRTIGLLNAQVVPLDEGVKLIGQSDAGSLALLDTQMAGHDVVVIPADPTAKPPTPNILNDSTNLFVGRGTYNLDPELQLGTIVTHGDPTGLFTNTFVGTDATWKSSTFQGDKNLNLAAWAGHSSGDLPAGNANGFGLDAEYPNDLWYAHVQYAQFGDALDPALGFVPRPGTRHYMNELNYQPRPASDSWFNWVHRFWFYGHYSEDDSFGPAQYLPPDPTNPSAPPQLLAKQGKQSSEWFLSPQMLTQGGWYWEFDVYQDYDSPTQQFSVVDDHGTAVNIPAGEYTYTRRRIVFNSPQSESLWWQVVASQGTFYAGTATHPSVTVNWNTPSGRLVLSATQEWLFYYQPQYLNPGQPDHGVARLSTLTGTYSFTPNLYLSTQMQYNQDVEKGVSYNLRLRWIVEGASNIYVVLNHGLVTETTGTNGSAVPAPGNEVIVKVQWDFRN